MPSRPRARLKILVAFGAMMLLLGGLGVVSAPPAQAADARNFKPGNIISDSLFYDGNAMNASAIQIFLDEKVPRCTIGDPGRKAGMPWPVNNSVIADSCLKNYRTTTTTQIADRYCNSYIGASNETAAQIIAKVAQACGISAKVLLVMLEKEQSLVTDSWPTARQLEVAMGANCPDSGPNWSASCDPRYYGFQKQVLRSAWLLKYYLLNPTQYQYRAHQWNAIQWHPNPGCGTSQVYIENSATAALYIYTPYRPNEAALNAQWGTGDSCSTYGNRNFYMLYETWFGGAEEISYPLIDAKLAQNPWLGSAISGYNLNLSAGGGVVRAYENGAITLQNGAAAARILSGDLRAYHASLGGLPGSLGWPTSDVHEHQRGTTQGFQGGAVSWTQASGAFTVLTGPIRTHYADWALAYAGPLGWPTGEEYCASSTECVQPFEFGSIVQSGASTAVKIDSISAVAGAHAAALGELTQTPRAYLANGGGFVQGHRNGAIAWTQGAGAHMISGAIRTEYGKSGGTSGSYGWPIGDQICDGMTCRQAFAGGTITVANTEKIDNAVALVQAAYATLKANGIDLGNGLGSVQIVASGLGGYVRGFENGAIAGSDRTPASAVMEPIRTFYNIEAGGLSGALGWPVGNARYESANGGGTVQGFEGGAIASSDTGTFVVTGQMRIFFNEKGGLTGNLGWPTSAMTVSGNEQRQSFQGGTVVLDTLTGVGIIL